MSAAKHTPGPWEVLDGRRVGVTLPSKVEGCGFYSHCIALTHSDRADINAEANARLIAAAPDLLDALRSCGLALQKDYLNKSPTIKNLVAHAARVIAKATGEGA